MSSKIHSVNSFADLCRSGGIGLTYFVSNFNFGYGRDSAVVGPGHALFALGEGNIWGCPAEDPFGIFGL